MTKRSRNKTISSCLEFSHNTLILLNEDNPSNQTRIVDTEFPPFCLLSSPRPSPHSTDKHQAEVEEGLWVIAKKGRGKKI